MTRSSRYNYILGLHEVTLTDVYAQIIKKSIQTSVGSGPSRQIRPIQDMESRILLYDLMNHGDASLKHKMLSARDVEVPEDHWFSLFRRFASDPTIS
jgi:hypothetical protein